MHKENVAGKIANVERKELKHKRINFKNSFFVLGNVFFIVILLLLIVSALFNVLGRGIPGIMESITTPEIQYSIKLSFFTSIVSTILCIIFSIPIAYGLERIKIPGKGLINTIIDIPLSLPPVVSRYVNLNNVAVISN